MLQKAFIQRLISKIKHDENVLGLAVGGSFITGEMDAFSDLDLILVTAEQIPPDIDRMTKYAKSFGDYLNGFTGEHVGEPRLLICLYNNPLLHVDIKFLTLEEFKQRIEDPIVIFDPKNLLKNVMALTKAHWPTLDYQWVEDRFWTWVHYATLKLGRGEKFEAMDFLSFMRSTVIAPLFQIKNKQVPRGVRKVEMTLTSDDLKALATTVPMYDEQSLFLALENVISLYRSLREHLFTGVVVLHTETERITLDYFSRIRDATLHLPSGR